MPHDPPQRECKIHCCPKPVENRDVRAAALKPGETNVPEHGPLACYAESRDGINWSKPVLRLYDYKGFRDNNIVWTCEVVLNLAPFKLHCGRPLEPVLMLLPRPGQGESKVPVGFMLTTSAATTGKRVDPLGF